MMIWVIVLTLLLLIVSFYCSRKNILSPAVIASGVWLSCFILYCSLDHNLYPLTGQFSFAFSLWIILFAFSSLLMQSLSSSAGNNYEPSKLMLDIYFWISVITYLMVLVSAYKTIAHGTTGSWSLDLRVAALEKTKISGLFAGLFVLVWKVSYAIELYYFSKKNRARVFLLLFFLLSYGVITMSKLLFMEMFMMTVCILYFKKIVTVKHLLFGGVALFFLLVGLQSVRNVDHDWSSGTGKSDFLVLYLLSNINSFETLEPFSSVHFGENTFRIFYAILHSCGLLNIEPVSIILSWAYVPIQTNTYTVMYPFFKDFGYWGVALFAAFLGLIWGLMFRKAQKGNVFFILLYSSFLYTIVMQYSCDLFITYISGFIKYGCLLALPFFATKHKWFVVKASR